MATKLQDISVKLTGAQIGATGTTYADGDAVGTLTELTNVCGGLNGYCSLQNVIVQDLSNQKSKLELLFFDSIPASTITDDAAFDLADADITKVVGQVIVAAADYESYADNAVGKVANIGQIMRSSGSNDLYMLVISRGTPTYVANELSFTLSFFKDEA